MFIDMILKHVSITKFILLWERLGTVSHLTPKSNSVRVPIQTGKPGKMGRHFPGREKSGNLNGLEKSGKIIQNTGKFREFQTNIVCYFLVIFN